jgi:hypothetical protein
MKAAQVVLSSSRRNTVVTGDGRRETASSLRYAAWRCRDCLQMQGQDAINLVLKPSESRDRGHVPPYKLPSGPLRPCPAEGSISVHEGDRQSKELYSSLPSFHDGHCTALLCALPGESGFLRGSAMTEASTVASHSSPSWAWVSVHYSNPCTLASAVINLVSVELMMEYA